MKNRYYQCSIISGSRKQEPNGEVKVASRLSTQFYPNLDTDNDSIIYSGIGDRLDLLAKQYYGDESFWFVIARSNNLGQGTLHIPPGMLIRIPRYAEYDGIGALVQSYNSER